MAEKLKNPEGMVARWIATLDSYDFDIEYGKGSQHGNSDALSRKPYRKCKRDCCKECLGLDSDVPRHGCDQRPGERSEAS